MSKLVDAVRVKDAGAVRPIGTGVDPLLTVHDALTPYTWQRALCYLITLQLEARCWISERALRDGVRTMSMRPPSIPNGRWWRKCSGSSGRTSATSAARYGSGMWTKPVSCSVSSRTRCSEGCDVAGMPKL